MKRNFLLLTIITAVLSSCSTSYRTGQTPDDVYYSPARLQTDEVRREREENTTNDNTVYTSTEDREIRRRIRNRRYRRYDDRYDYPNGYNGPVYVNPKYGTTQNPSEPRKTNLGAYKPNTTSPDSVTYSNPKLGNTNTTGTTTTPVRTFGTPNKTSNNGSAVGNLIRKVFTTDNTYNNNSGNSNTSTPTRTFDRGNTNNNSSSSNTRSTSSDTKTSSSSSSSSAPVRTFGKQ